MLDVINVGPFAMSIDNSWSAYVCICVSDRVADCTALQAQKWLFEACLNLSVQTRTQWKPFG